MDWNRADVTADCCCIFGVGRPLLIGAGAASLSLPLLVENPFSSWPTFSGEDGCSCGNVDVGVRTEMGANMSEEVEIAACGDDPRHSNGSPVKL
jgi:hypothetical protein